jgi:hypothetical protein
MPLCPQEVVMIGFGRAPSWKSDVGFDLSVAPDKQTLTLLFDNLTVAAGKLRPIHTRVFDFALPLEEGGTAVEIAFFVQGYVVTHEGSSATMVFSVNGQTTVADFSKTSDTSYKQNLKFTADTASECRLCVFLLAGQDQNSDPQAYLSVDAIDAAIQRRA